MCPNIYECWEAREATFLSCGRVHAPLRVLRRDDGQAGAARRGRAGEIAEAVRAMGLRHAVLTGVARDDLDDGGSRTGPRPSARSETRCRAAGSRS